MEPCIRHGADGVERRIGDRTPGGVADRGTIGIEAPLGTTITGVDDTVSP
jgi:hypothetical protein